MIRFEKLPVKRLLELAHAGQAVIPLASASLPLASAGWRRASLRWSCRYTTYGQPQSSAVVIVFRTVYCRGCAKSYNAPGTRYTCAAGCTRLSSRVLRFRQEGPPGSRFFNNVSPGHVRLEFGERVRAGNRPTILQHQSWIHRTNSPACLDGRIASEREQRKNGSLPAMRVLYRMGSLSLSTTASIMVLLATGMSRAGENRDSQARRYETQDPLSLTVPRRPVTRGDYVEFLRPWAEDYEMTPQADQWGWRHGPLNPTAIIGLERSGVAMAEMTSEKFIVRENAVRIADRSGTATYLGRKDHPGEKSVPLGWAGMESTVPLFSDHELATHARVDVAGYQGYQATQRREFLFIKNGFVLVRDETEFDDTFRAEVGPVWNTQHVGHVRGDHWINTWFSAHFFDGVLLFEEKPWDLLVWYAPRENAELKVTTPDRAAQAQQGSRMFPTQYCWEGDVRPGEPLQFVTVLLPHAPTRDASDLAAGITVLADQPGLAAVRITRGSRCELAVLNPRGTKLDLDAGAAGRVSTDARTAYIDLDGASLHRALIIEGTSLKVGAEDLLRSADRTNWERAK